MLDWTWFLAAYTLIALFLICVPAIYFVIISTIADRAHGIRRAPAAGGFAVLPARQNDKRRYAILHHTGVVPEHFDLMFETADGSTLATWRSPAWPITTPTVIERLADHRADYLEYEGPVSGGRGTVRRVAGGRFTTVARTADRWVVGIEGGMTLILRRTGKDAAWQAEVGQTI